MITDGTEQYERFVRLPQPISFKVYIFNVTNVNRIQQGAIPIVEEVGPYIYKYFFESNFFYSKFFSNNDFASNLDNIEVNE